MMRRFLKWVFKKELAELIAECELHRFQAEKSMNTAYNDARASLKAYQESERLREKYERLLKELGGPPKKDGRRMGRER